VLFLCSPLGRRLVAPGQHSFCHIQTPEREKKEGESECLKGKKKEERGEMGRRSMKDAIVTDNQWPLESAHKSCDATSEEREESFI